MTIASSHTLTPPLPPTPPDHSCFPKPKESNSRITVTAGRKRIRQGLRISKRIAKRPNYEGKETIFLCGLCVWCGELRIRASQSSGLDGLKDLAGSAFLMSSKPGNKAFNCLLQCFSQCHHFHVRLLAHFVFSSLRISTPVWSKSILVILDCVVHHFFAYHICQLGILRT